MAVGNVQIMNLPVVGGSNLQQFGAFSSEQSINCYPYYDDRQNTSALYRYPGYEKIFDFPGTGLVGRPGGAISTNEFAFFVLGDTLFKVDNAFAPTAIGTLGTSSGPVSMSLTGDYLAVVDGSATKQVFDIVTGVPTPITGTFNPNYVAEQQNFTFYNNDGTQQIFQSAPGAPFTVNPISNIFINYQSSAAYPLLAMKSINGNLLCFTRNFIETLVDEGKAGFAFEPDTNLFYEFGALNATSIAKGTLGSKGQQQSSFIVFLSLTPDGSVKVMITKGGTPEVLSTDSINFRLTQLTAPEEGVAFISNVGGQTFYQISFPTDELTLVYNFESGEWFDVKHNDTYHPAISYAYLANTPVFTSAFDGGLYRFNPLLNTNDGVPFPITRVTYPIRMSGYRKFTINRIRFWFQQGTGLGGSDNPLNTNFTYGSDPVVNMFISENGGQTFPKTEPMKLGQVGRTQWVSDVDQLGTWREITLKLEQQTPTDFCLMGAQMWYTLTEGSS